MDIERVVVRLFADASQYNRVMTGVESRLRDWARMSSSMGQMIVDPILNLSNALFSLTRAMAESGYAAVQAAAHYEVMGVQLELLARNADRGQELMREMFQTATETPFQVREVVAAGKEIAAFGFEVDDIIPVLKALGDISAATGTPMHRLILAFGQTRIAGRLMGQEMRQFVNANVPLMENLARVLGKPQAQIKKMIENGQVGFESVVEALNLLIRERYPNVMDRINKTTQGQWIAFTETLEIGLARIGSAFLTEFDLRGVFSEWRQAINSINPENSDIAIFFRNTHKGLLIIRDTARFASAAVSELYDRISAITSPIFESMDLRGFIDQHHEAIKVLGGLLIVMTSIRVAVYLGTVAVKAATIAWIAFGGALSLLNRLFGIAAIMSVINGYLWVQRGLVWALTAAWTALRAAYTAAAAVYALHGAFAALYTSIAGLPLALRIFAGSLIFLMSVLHGVFLAGYAIIAMLQGMVLAFFSFRTAFAFSMFLFHAWTGFVAILSGISAVFVAMGTAIMAVGTALRAVIVLMASLSAMAVVWRVMAAGVLLWIAALAAVPVAITAIIYLLVKIPAIIRAIRLLMLTTTAISVFTAIVSGIMAIGTAIMTIIPYIGGIVLLGTAIYYLKDAVVEIGKSLFSWSDFGNMSGKMGNELKKMVDSLVGTFKTAWSGISAAISMGDYRKAAEIAFKALEVAFEILINTMLRMWEHFRYEIRKTFLGLQIDILEWWLDVRLVIDPTFSETEAFKKAEKFSEDYKNLWKRNDDFHLERIKDLGISEAKKRKELEEMVGGTKEAERLSKMTEEGRKLEAIAKNIAEYSQDYIEGQEARFSIVKDVREAIKAFDDWVPVKDFEFIPKEVVQRLKADPLPIPQELRNKFDLGFKDREFLFWNDLEFDQTLAKKIIPQKDLIKKTLQGSLVEWMETIQKYEAGFKGRKEGSMREYTTEATPSIMTGLAAQFHLLSNNMGEFVKNLGEIVDNSRKAVNQFPRHYSISAEAKTIAEKYAQKGMRGVGEETHQFDFFLREMRLIEEARTGLIPELQRVRDEGSAIERMMMNFLGEKNRALDDDQAAYALLSSFDRLKKYVGDRHSTGPRMMLEGSSEAQDTINRTKTQPVTVLEQIRQIMMIGQTLQQSQLEYQKEAVDALRKLTGEKPAPVAGIAIGGAIGFVGR